MDHPENIVNQLIQQEDRSKWIAHSNHNVKCFTEDEMKRFTNNYETILGRGGFGEVYKGVLEDKSMVAVKRFICNIKENFAKELTVHREINHKNVVRLVGYCLDENALMVITEYIPKGNLSNILHHDSTPIALDTRLKIAIECAEALGYMHSQMYTQVIHGDIKPANILLDDGLGAKLSDFGISRLVNTADALYTQNVKGSRGYMDPLFYQSGRLTPKSDVYSFGVMLLELITRKKASDDNGPTALVERFTQALPKGIRRVREMFDAEIATHNNIKTIEGIAKLSGKCLKLELDKRPEMLEVAECLRKLRKALHQGQERLAIFSWGRKNKLAPGETAPLQESSSSSHYVGIATPAESTTSKASSSSSDYVGIAAPAESTTSQESSSSIHYVGIATPAESTTSEASSSSSDYVGIAAPAESTTSQESSSSTTKEGTFIAGSRRIRPLFDLDTLLRRSALLGVGTVGRSYMAKLESTDMLVVKKLRTTVDIPKRDFDLHAEGIGAIQDEYIAPLLWYYWSSDEMLLVYDFFPMGSLAHALHGNPVSPAPLAWDQRVALALAAARGVGYIHSAGPSSCHGNIKSSNVMLLATHDACLSEHGLTTLVPSTGASGYSAPEITDGKWFSQEADVYSFGVLLLEIFTRKDPLNNTQLEDGVNLPQWVCSVAQHEWAAKVIDAELLVQQQKDGEDECMVRILQLAIHCCSEDANLRTTMSDVVQRIEKMQIDAYFRSEALKSASRNLKSILVVGF